MDDTLMGQVIGVATMSRDEPRVFAAVDLGSDELGD
jgi:hypothetical protein